MEKKFTPGNWINKSADGHYFGGAAAVNSADDKSTIALVYGHPEEEMAANARLIAAAPEMFDILESLEIGFRKRGAVDLEMLRIADGIKEILTKATTVN